MKDLVPERWSWGYSSACVLLHRSLEPAWLQGSAFETKSTFFFGESGGMEGEGGDDTLQCHPHVSRTCVKTAAYQGAPVGHEDCRDVHTPIILSKCLYVIEGPNYVYLKTYRE